MRNSKICFKCNVVKDISDFYAHKRMADGHLNKCILCTKKDEKERRLLKIDYLKEYDRSRDKLPSRIELKKKYSQTEKGKEAARKAKKKWIDSNIIKRAAHLILNNAVKSGEVIKKNKCESCSKEGKIHAHHDNYAFPLNVQWLCPKCHTKWHKENGEGLNCK